METIEIGEIGGVVIEENVKSKTIDIKLLGSVVGIITLFAIIIFIMVKQDEYNYANVKIGDRTIRAETWHNGYQHAYINFNYENINYTLMIKTNSTIDYLEIPDINKIDFCWFMAKGGLKKPAIKLKKESGLCHFQLAIID
ncbi:hypothetical protein K8R66_01525 [bacterium]|nr:hypothetical protein [bacterium]